MKTSRRNFFQTLGTGTAGLGLGVNPAPGRMQHKYE